MRKAFPDLTRVYPDELRSQTRKRRPAPGDRISFGELYCTHFRRACQSTEKGPSGVCGRSL